MGPLQQLPLVALCFLVGFRLLSRLVRQRQDSASGHLRVNAPMFEVNDSLDQLQIPSGIPRMQILFFHGLPFGNFSLPHLSTWDSGDGFIWPHAWLAEQFPGAHVFFVKYSEGMKVGGFNMNNIGENLISDLIQGNIGQVPGCPVVLVGHCIGGLVIKELCLKAHEQLRSSKPSMSDRANKLGAFLDNLRGIFYYSTPHRGIPEIAKAREILKSPLFKYFEILSTDAAVLNENFNNLCGLYPNWKIQGIGESLPMKSGVFQNVIVVPEASAREGIFNTVVEDHFSICKPVKKTSGGFYHLTDLLDGIFKENITLHDEICPQNLQHLPECIRGIEIPLKEVKARLENVKKLGLTGMGGLGKTTLAKAIFNDLCPRFEYTCFVSDVKLIDGNVLTLKTEVGKQMYRNGKKIVGDIDWSQLRGKRLLLILDDVSSDRDMKCLSEIAEGPSAESRYVATSRGRDLFDNIYEVPLLDESNAHKLFMSFAFQDEEIPPLKLALIAKEIVEKCERLPLTLEVIGQWLKRTKDEEDWRQTLDALDKAECVTHLNERIWAKLRPSIDGLEENEKQMFLDATTFFYNDRTFTDAPSEWPLRWTLHEAQAAWREAYGVNERLMWRTLVERSLVYEVEEDKAIKVHEQLRSLGRKIASEFSEHGKSRVLEISMALKLLQSTTELDKKNVHALRLVGGHMIETQMHMEEIHELQSTPIEENLGGIFSVDGKIHVSSHTLQKLEKLRFLEVDNSIVVDGVEEAKCFPSSLVVFKWIRGKFLNCAHQRRLVVLKIGDHDLEYLPKSIGQLSALRILVLYSAQFIETVPDEIGDLKQLEFLHFLRCPKLQTLPQRFGQLSKLKVLKLGNCDSLRNLPKSFGNLSALEHIEIRGVELEALPESIGRLSKLKVLKLEYCICLRNLPKSFGNLSALEHIEIRCVELEALPESIGQLSKLKVLKLEYSDSLRNLPKSFGNLSALEHIEIRRVGLEALPESVGQLAALRFLQVTGCNQLKSFPEPFGQLSALSRLELCNCDSLQSLPESFGQLAKLQYLRIDALIALERLPDSFAELLTLRHLIIQKCLSMKSFPNDIRNLPLLHTLELGVLPHVRELPSWLGEAGVNSLAFSRNIYRIQDCRFSLSKKESEEPSELVHLVHHTAMRKVETSDFKGALAALEVISSLEVLELDAFLFQEKGIVKRMMGDLHGALEDLTAALEWHSKANKGHRYRAYICWKHRGYVKFFMGDPKGAESDGTMALKLEIDWGRKYRGRDISDSGVDYRWFKSLGEESIRYMNFTLTGRQEMVDHPNLMYSSHKEVMEKVKASDFQGALVIFDGILVALLSNHDQATFFQERGILKRLAGDLGGALEDLTAALEVLPEDYDCFKHRGYVKFLLGDVNGARMDAEKCLTLEREETTEEYLGGTPVAFLEFKLK